MFLSCPVTSFSVQEFRAGLRQSDEAPLRANAPLAVAIGGAACLAGFILVGPFVSRGIADDAGVMSFLLGEGARRAPAARPVRTAVRYEPSMDRGFWRDSGVARPRMADVMPRQMHPKRPALARKAPTAIIAVVTGSSTVLEEGVSIPRRIRRVMMASPSARAGDAARKHAGRQPKGWLFEIAHLHEKSGSLVRVSDFALQIRRIAARQPLPGYRLRMEWQGRRELLRILPAHLSTVPVDSAVDAVGTSHANGIGTPHAALSGLRTHEPQLTLWPETAIPGLNLESNSESNSIVGGARSADKRSAAPLASPPVQQPPLPFGRKPGGKR